MQLKKQLKQNLSLALFGTLLLALHPVNAETDFASQERLLKARVKSYEEKTDHSAHLKPVEKHLEFHGVFYGFLPCEDCN
ncbi:MAG: copper resistance protein NlpE, partial [Methylococcaceae bacterium]